MAASPPTCDFCHDAEVPRIRLDQEEGKQILSICLPCLRSNLVMKAARSEERGVRLLRQDAEEQGLHLWRSRHAVYVLPARSQGHDLPSPPPLAASPRSIVAKPSLATR